MGLSSSPAWRVLRAHPAGAVVAVLAATVAVSVIVVGTVTVAAWAIAGAGGDVGGRLAALAVGLFVAEVRPRRPRS